MTDMMNLHGFQGQEQPQEAAPVIRTPATIRSQHEAIGSVIEISGGGSRIKIDAQRLRDLASNPDPSVALSGQVGSQVKLECGRKWLLANVRNLKVSAEDEAVVIADFDFRAKATNMISPASWSTSSAASPAIPSPAIACTR